jgi:hypothetical protein
VSVYAADDDDNTSTQKNYTNDFMPLNQKRVHARRKRCDYSKNLLFCETSENFYFFRVRRRCLVIYEILQYIEKIDSFKKLNFLHFL